MHRIVLFFLRLGQSLAGSFQKIDRGVMLASAGLVFLMMLLVVADIIGRNIFLAPVPSGYEIAEAAMVFIIFLALAYTEETQGHIRIEILSSRLRGRTRAIVDIFGCLVGMLLFSLVIWLTWEQALDSWEVREYMSGPLPLPVYPAKFIVPIGSALIVVQFLTGLIRNAIRVSGRGGGQ